MCQTVTPYNPHLHPREEQGDAPPPCNCAPWGHSDMRRRRKLWPPQVSLSHAHEEEGPELIETTLRELLRNCAHREVVQVWHRNMKLNMHTKRRPTGVSHHETKQKAQQTCGGGGSPHGRNCDTLHPRGGVGAERKAQR